MGQCKNEKSWNILLTILYPVLIAFFLWLFYSTFETAPSGLEPFEFILLSLAVFRLIRLFVYDRITQFVRDWFIDGTPCDCMDGGQCARSGFNSAISHLFSCPWCVGVWAALPLVFFYFYTPFTFFLVVVLAVAGAGSFIQLVSNMFGWRAENLKIDANSKV